MLLFLSTHVHLLSAENTDVKTQPLLGFARKVPDDSTVSPLPSLQNHLQHKSLFVHMGRILNAPSFILDRGFVLNPENHNGDFNLFPSISC